VGLDQLDNFVYAAAMVAACRIAFKPVAVGIDGDGWCAVWVFLAQAMHMNDALAVPVGIWKAIRPVFRQELEDCIAHRNQF